jgi:hypothetical protein
MRIAKLAIAGILAFAAALPWAPPAQANSSSAVVRVQATIRPWLKFSATQLASTYQVTAEDIRRGHIDLPQAITVQIQTNIPEEIHFDIASGGPERILVGDGGSIPTDAFRITGAKPAVPVTRTLDMRVVLPAGTTEGTYPLMVALAPTAY